MTRLAIRLLTLDLCTTALALAPTVTPAKAATSSSGHVHKHKKHWRAHVSEPWYVGQAQAFQGFTLASYAAYEGVIGTNNAACISVSEDGWQR